MEEIKTMMVHNGTDFKKYPHCPRQIPISLLNEDMARRNHSQSLSRLNARGGMCPTEIMANIEGNGLAFILKDTESNAIERLIKVLNQPQP